MKYLKLFEQFEEDWWKEESPFDNLEEEDEVFNRIEMCKFISFHTSIPLHYLINLEQRTIENLYNEIKEKTKR